MSGGLPSARSAVLAGIAIALSSGCQPLLILGYSSAFPRRSVSCPEIWQSVQISGHAFLLVEQSEVSRSLDIQVLHPFVTFQDKPCLLNEWNEPASIGTDRVLSGCPHGQEIALRPRRG